jgi:hypothetical protein
MSYADYLWAQTMIRSTRGWRRVYWRIVAWWHRP